MEQIELRITKLAISVYTAKIFSIPDFRSKIFPYFGNSITFHGIDSGRKISLQRRRILGGRKLLFCVRTVVTAVFDIVMEEDEERVKIVTLRVGARVKEGKEGGGGEKKYSPHFLLSISSFNMGHSRAKHSHARRKRLHCRLEEQKLNRLSSRQDLSCSV